MFKPEISNFNLLEGNNLSESISKSISACHIKCVCHVNCVTIPIPIPRR